MGKSKISIVKETDSGLYVWEMDNGQWIMDEERNVLSMPSIEGDQYKLGKFKEFVHNLLRNEGVEPNGHPVFLPGHRQITEEQYQEQLARQALGLTPDPFDVGAAMSELEYAKRFGK